MAEARQKMFVANCSQQEWWLSWRPAGQSVRRQKIMMGGQVQVSGDSSGTLSIKDIENVIAQNSVYGLVNITEIDRTKPFVGICYNLDRPISVGTLHKAIDHNQKVLVARGEQTREETAIALNAMASEAGTLRSLEVEVREESRDAKDESPEVAVAMRVTADPERGAPQQGQRRGKAQRRAG